MNLNQNQRPQPNNNSTFPQQQIIVIQPANISLPQNIQQNPQQLQVNRQFQVGQNLSPLKRLLECLFFTYCLLYSIYYQDIKSFQMVWILWFIVFGTDRYGNEPGKIMIAEFLNLTIWIWANIAFFFRNEEKISIQLYLVINIQVYYTVGTIVLNTILIGFVGFNSIIRYYRLYQIKKNLKKKKEQLFITIQAAPQIKIFNDLCPICLIQLPTIQLPCHHQFHNQCIKEWLEQKNTCPVCRQKLF